MTDSIEFTPHEEDSGSAVSGQFVMRNAGHMVPRDGEGTEGDLPDILIYEPPVEDVDGFEPLTELTTDQPEVLEDGSGEIAGHYTQLVWAE